MFTQKKPPATSVNEILQAITRHDAAALQTLLAKGEVDVNQEMPPTIFTLDKLTCLHLVVRENLPDLINVLLAHPLIDPNRQSLLGFTPFGLACELGFVDVLKVLLEDNRVLLDLPSAGATPIRRAAYRGHVDVVRWIIVSGRDFDSDISDRGQTSLVDNLLERFRQDPPAVRMSLCLQMGLRERLVAERFALVVFYCDGYMAVKTWMLAVTGKMKREKRFLAIMSRLPMEIQQVVCHRVYWSPGERIASTLFDREVKRTVVPMMVRPAAESQEDKGLFRKSMLCGVIILYLVGMPALLALLIALFGKWTIHV